MVSDMIKELQREKNGGKESVGQGRESTERENKRDEKKEKVRDIKNFMFLVFPRVGSL